MKYKATFLLDKKNKWIEIYLKNFNFKLNNKFSFKITNNYKTIKKQDLVFVLSYTKILSDSFLKRNKLTLVVHSSKLPRDRGFAPLTYRVLQNSNIIFFSLFQVVKKVDSGNIFLRTKLKLNGTELYDELRKKQAETILNLIKKFLIKYPLIKSSVQSGKTNYNKRRYPRDSELDINKNIKSQFNLMRVSDNEKFPIFFYHKSVKYILKIFKDL